VLHAASSHACDCFLLSRSLSLTHTFGFPSLLLREAHLQSCLPSSALDATAAPVAIAPVRPSSVRRAVATPQSRSTSSHAPATLSTQRSSNCRPPTRPLRRLLTQLLHKYSRSQPARRFLLLHSSRQSRLRSLKELSTRNRYCNRRKRQTSHRCRSLRLLQRQCPTRPCFNTCWRWDTSLLLPLRQLCSRHWQHPCFLQFPYRLLPLLLFHTWLPSALLDQVCHHFRFRLSPIQRKG
jgi:hypothetical protein